jgi:hypothetical protein
MATRKLTPSARTDTPATKPAPQSTKKRTPEQPTDLMFTPRPNARILLDGSFVMPDPERDDEALAGVWSMLVIAYQYIGHRFEMSARDIPNTQHVMGDRIDRAHAQLRLAIDAFGTAWSDTDAYRKGLLPEQKEVRRAK